jgi:BASS family bile acid:Na+ symporter
MGNGFLGLFAGSVIFFLMLAIGVNQTREDLTSAFRERERLLRSLLAVVVLVPVLVIVVLLVFNVPPAAATALAVLAAAPGAPLTTFRSQMAGADTRFVSSLQLTLAFSAVIVTPLVWAIFAAMFESVIERATAFDVARQVAQVTFLPVIIGLLLQRFAPGFAARIGKPLNKLADLLFVLLVLVVIVLLVASAELRGMLAVGWLTVAAIVIMAAGALAIGHALGGTSQDQRAGLATACIARNVGLAIFLVALDDAGQGAIPVILAYMLLGAAIAVPYAKWSKRHLPTAGEAK